MSSADDFFETLGGIAPRYVIREVPRYGISQVIDAADPDTVLFAGLAEDCEAWVNDPSSRPTGKPEDYPF